MSGVNKHLEILAELYFKHKGDKDFEEFFEYNNIGLPLAYLVGEGLATITPIGEKYISETYGILIESLSADHEAVYESLEDLFSKFSM